MKPMKPGQSREQLAWLSGLYGDPMTPEEVAAHHSRVAAQEERDNRARESEPDLFDREQAAG